MNPLFRFAGAIALTATMVTQVQAADKRLQVLDWSAQVPANWIAEQPQSNYRLAQLRVPSSKAGADGEVIVYYFGRNQGGPVQANVDRWISQFTTADGKPVKPIIKTYAVKKMPVTAVELNGSYARSVGMQASMAPRPDQTLLAAVVETPKGNLTFHLHGPRSTVQANKDAFWKMVRSL